MCGRARLSSGASEIKIRFSIPPGRPTPNFAPSWNVAPTDPLPVVGFNPKARERGLDVMRWGLVPFWAKDIKVSFANIHHPIEVRERNAQRQGLAFGDVEGRAEDVSRASATARVWISGSPAALSRSALIRG